jgi:hypothetical protein
MRLLGLLLLAFLAGCSEDQPTPPGMPWTIGPIIDTKDYSQGMPLHPVGTDQNWYFDFPRYDEDPSTTCAPKKNCPGVHYVQRTVNSSIADKKVINIAWHTVTTGTPVYQYELDPDNHGCRSPARVTVILQHTNDDWVTYYYRWFSNARLELTAGSGNFAIPLTIDQWADVMGGTDASRFADTLSHLANFGVVFGGGCAAGHGLNVANGTARFTMTGWTIE